MKSQFSSETPFVANYRLQIGYQKAMGDVRACGRKPKQYISTVYFGDAVVTSGYSIVAIRLSFALVYPSPITAASLQLQGLMPMNFCFGFLVCDLPCSLTTADASQRKESPMKTEIEISLFAALLALVIYAGGLIMLLVYIVHSFWLVTPQADPFCCF